LWAALDWLNQEPPQSIYGAPVTDILSWAKSNWRLQHIREKVTQMGS
jgi:hypothetical protein